MINVATLIKIQMSQNKYGQQKIGMSGCYAYPDAHASPIELPLQSFTYDVEIVDFYAQVQMTQTYINNQNKALDVQYVFPIHPASTVTKLEVEFGGKKSQGVVMEKKQAKDQFDKQLKEGTAVAYSQFNRLSRDIMKMVIGNIRPQQTVKVVLTYVHLNSLVCNTFYQFKLTSTMTPRYARRMQFPYLSFDQFGVSKKVEGRCFWRVKVNIKSSRRIIKTESASHKLKILQKENNQISLTFAEGNELPNKDFILYYAIQNYQRPLYSLSHSDNSTTAAISFIPKYCKLSIDDAYKQLSKGGSFQVDLDASKGQYIFLLDRSGSMDGIRIDNAKRALQLFLRSLPEDSYFNVLSFGSNFKYLFQRSVKNSKKDIDFAVEQISKMSADMGGTQILEAIRSLIALEVIPGYPRQLFFLTDGAVDNVNEVLKFVSRHTQHTRINSIGIGNGCSQELIKGCAEKGKGYSILIADEQMPEQKIITLLQNTLSPIITDFSLEFGKDEKVESIVPNPKKMPFILKNDIVNFFISFNGKIVQPFDIIIKYQDTLGTNYREKLTIDPKGQHSLCPWLHHLVNSQKIQALLDSFNYGQQQQDRIYYVKKIDKNELKEEIVKLSVKHQILTQLTAFLCIDQYSLDQVNKLIANNPKEKISIKGMNPYDHIVDFVNEGERQYEDGGYVDECCIMDYQLPFSELQKIAKFEEIPKIHRKMIMLARVAGQPNSNMGIDGVRKFPNPERKLAYSYIMKQQQVNGAWKTDFLDSIFSNSSQLRSDFEKHTDKVSYLTFLVCQFFIRYYSKDPQFTMLIKKGKNYIEKHSKSKWAELQNLFHKYYKPLSS